MNWHHWFHWLPSRTVRRTRRTRPRRTPWRFVRPCLERLENRIAPTFSLGAAANGNSNITAPLPDPAAKTDLTIIPNPSTVTLSATAPPILKATATLSQGNSPTGTIIFQLFKGTTLDTETVPVNGNGSYTTPTGFTLPTSGTVTGDYLWSALYSGDKNNSSAPDKKLVTVNPATPTLTTIPNPITVTLGAAAPPILKDTADLEGGFNPTGTITFQLVKGTTQVDIETVTVKGNGTYTTPTGFTLPILPADTGDYRWFVSYSGDGNNNKAFGNPTEELVTVIPASPTLTTAPNTTTVTLGAAAPPILKDTADLEGGFNPAGTITFELFQGSTLVHTETVTVNGNGSYTTPTGFTLPTSGTVTGTYEWVAVYSGDFNNNEVSDSNPTAELVTVSPASPTLVTTASPAMVTLPAPVPTILTDTATLSGGNDPTGTITFLLFQGTTRVDRETVTVNGNGSYTTPTGFTLPTSGTVTGTYEWVVLYSGDGNNDAADDQGGTAEQTVVGAASLTLVTIASPNVTLPTGPPGTVTLSDAAFLSGGHSPTGNIVFTLSGPGGFSFTKDVTVNGNGTYTASTTLPTTGTVAGTYTWTARYSGDGNNNAANDQGGIAEQTMVRPANPTLVTIASPLETTLPAGPPGTVTLEDSALLSGGYFPTGTIVFTLSGPGGFSETRTDTVNGNGTYTASITLPTTGTVAGTYIWSVIYEGDANNNEAIDQGGPDEQVTVAPANPTLVTTASPAITLGTTAPTLSDTADLEGGFFPTGNIVFTLSGPGGFSETRTDTVNGNGTYTASTTLPTTGTVAGTYTWSVTYAGDDNNNPVNDQGGPTEQTVVSPASPAISTTPSPSTAMLGATLQDSADLTGGFDPTGDIIFSLYAPGVDPTVGPATHTETVGVNGNGTYHTTVGFASNASGIWHWVATYSGDDNNNSVSSGPVDEPVTISSEADVSLTKKVNQTTAISGSPVTYTLIVNNNGPDTATGVVATDILPTGLVFVSATPSQGSFDAGSGRWTIGTLPNGATATLQITGTVVAIGPITNTASVTAVQFDPDLANNVSAVTIDGMFSAGSVSKSFFLSPSDAPSNAAVLAAEEALFNALVPLWTNLWDALLSEAQSLLASRNDPGPGNGGVPIFEGNWLGSPFAVYANPLGQVTAVQVGAFDFLYEDNAVAGVRLL
jgi:uncharacterized repeat protein (TIGR01451 family)